MFTGHFPKRGRVATHPHHNTVCLGEVSNSRAVNRRYERYYVQHSGSNTSWRTISGSNTSWRTISGSVLGEREVGGSVDFARATHGKGAPCGKDQFRGTFAGSRLARRLGFRHAESCARLSEPEVRRRLHLVHVPLFGHADVSQWAQPIINYNAVSAELSGFEHALGPFLLTNVLLSSAAIATATCGSYLRWRSGAQPKSSVSGWR